MFESVRENNSMQQLVLSVGSSKDNSSVTCCRGRLEKCFLLALHSAVAQEQEIWASTARQSPGVQSICRALGRQSRKAPRKLSHNVYYCKGQP